MVATQCHQDKQIVVASEGNQHFTAVLFHQLCNSLCDISVVGM